MKRILLGAAALSVVFATSCKKNDDNNNSNGNNTPSNTWTLNGTSYTAKTVTKMSQSGVNIITATDASANAVEFFFSSLPTASGSYKVVYGATPGSGEVSIVTANATAQNGYTSTGNDNVTANITVNNGQVNISVPDTWMKSVLGSDSVKLNANITAN